MKYGAIWCQVGQSCGMSVPQKSNHAGTPLARSTSSMRWLDGSSSSSQAPWPMPEMIRHER